MYGSISTSLLPHAHLFEIASATLNRYPETRCIAAQCTHEYRLLPYSVERFVRHAACVGEAHESMKCRHCSKGYTRLCKVGKVHAFLQIVFSSLYIVGYLERLYLVFSRFYD